MKSWTNKLFIERADLFLKLLNQRWPLTEGLTNGMTRLLKDNGITSGNLLDLCCGNGRISIHMAKKGFKAVGVDMSQAFLEDAKKKGEIKAPEGDGYLFQCEIEGKNALGVMLNRLDEAYGGNRNIELFHVAIFLNDNYVPIAVDTIIDMNNRT